MPSAEIRFANTQATGNPELGGAPGVAVNVVVDDTGAVRRRPGLEAIPGVFSGAMDNDGFGGLHVTVNGAIYAVTRTPPFRRIYRMDGAFPVGIATGTGDDTLAGTTRPVFAETQLLLAIAGGGPMQKIVLGTNTASRLGGDPPFASHVAANSSRLLGNIAEVSTLPGADYDKSVVRFSDIANGNTSYAGLETWTEGLSTAGHFSAEANPDPVLAIYENTNDVFCFGAASLQIFSPDPTAVYSPSTTREIGISAPYSVVKVNQEFAWFDNYRRVVVGDGRSETVISDPMKKTFDDIGTVSDCFGYRATMGPMDAMVWSFPTDGRTFSFQKGSGWSEWLGWNSDLNNWKPFRVTAHSFSTRTNTSVIGTDDGRVGRLSLDAATDFGDRIVARVDTGYINRGTDARKHCRCVRIALRRGQSQDDTGPQALLSWRDQPGAYGPPLSIDLGGQGDTEIVLEFHSLGMYRRRQWRFEFSGTEALELLSVVEEYDVLGT